MKKKNQKSTLLFAVLLLTACEKVVLDDDGGTHLRFIPTTADTRGTVSIGDYFSRLAVQLFDADGQKVWSQSKTQTRDDDDFGTLFSAGGSLSLSLNGEWQGSCQGSW